MHKAKSTMKKRGMVGNAPRSVKNLSGIYFLGGPRDIVKHMSLASLAMDGRGGVSAVRHVCNAACVGKHPDSLAPGSP